MSPPFPYSFKPVWLSALTDRVTERATDIPLVVNCGWTHFLPFDFFHQWLVKKDLPFNPPTLFFFIHLVINPTSLYRLLSSNFSLCVSFFLSFFVCCVCVRFMIVKHGKRSRNHEEEGAKEGHAQVKTPSSSEFFSCVYLYVVSGAFFLVFLQSINQSIKQ
ncbi:hypothetical protein F5H01DRAFT_20334 [Linnemannia elongata]|nr:hypothetical protein F5H01DRAFT_20334 [Linnemannia elongata]